MIRQITPVFFTTDIPGTLAYYEDKLGFACLGTWHDPPVYAIVARDERAIHFRCAEPPTANPDKYEEELLDAYISVEDADALFRSTRPSTYVGAFRLFEMQAVYSFAVQCDEIVLG